MGTPAPTIIPAIRYDDAPAAIDFLERAFGFEVNARHDGEDGRVDHAQLTHGSGMVMLGSSSGDQFDTAHTSIYVIVTDPDGLHERAVAAGADITRGLTDEEYGSREFTARDPEGNTWSFGTYHPDM